MSTIRKKAITGLKIGDTFVVSRVFTETDARFFADMSKDYNPVHFEQRFAAAKEFDGLICHGLLVGSMLTEIGGQIGWLASEMHFRFKKPVYFGERVTCKFTITDIDDRGRAKANAAFAKDDGTLVLEAVLKGRLPGEEEKKIMAEMADGNLSNKLSTCGENS